MRQVLHNILKELKVTPEMQAKWEAQKNYVDRFKLEEEEPLLFLVTCTNVYGVLSFPGTLFIYENFLCFHRILRPEFDKISIPMKNIQRILKAMSPPFFDNGLQVPFSILIHPISSFF